MSYAGLDLQEWNTYLIGEHMETLGHGRRVALVEVSWLPEVPPTPLPALSTSASMNQRLAEREARTGSDRPATASSFATMGTTNDMPSNLPAEDSPFLYHYLYQICLALVVDLKRGSTDERQGRCCVGAGERYGRDGEVRQLVLREMRWRGAACVLMGKKRHGL